MLMTMRMETRQEQIIRQTQRLDILLELRSQLIGLLRGREFKPKAECPKCFCQLSLAQIIMGFSRDPNDINTTCPSCGTRFPAQLQYQDAIGSTTISFFCPCQTLDRLRNLSHLSPAELEKNDLALYQSAITHFGNLTYAFAEVGINYGHQETIEWQQKIKPFLGLLPDAEIARCANIPVATVRRMRNKLGLCRYYPN